MINFLKAVPLLHCLRSHELESVATAMEDERFAAGDTIIVEGEKGSTFYIIMKGTVVIHQASKGNVGELGPGEYFGERALMTAETRTATIRAQTNCELLSMGLEDFTMLIGALKDIVNRDKEIAAEAHGKINFDVYANKYEKKVPFSDLTAVGVLGQGAFGTVNLVKDTHGNAFALKIMAKAKIMEMNLEAHTAAERNVQAALDHPFLLRLYNSYKDDCNLYLLLELCQGGEMYVARRRPVVLPPTCNRQQYMPATSFFSTSCSASNGICMHFPFFLRFTVLHTIGNFPERDARFYVAGVVLGFIEMHRHKIAYRDLKPENLLMDRDGFPKLCDFGLAKVVDGKTWTLCGTPDYLAPEIILSKGHDRTADLWALGVLVYELCTGYAPFSCDDPMEVYQLILECDYEFPRGTSKNMRDLVNKLLQHVPSKRLGATGQGTETVKMHKWFDGFDWSGMLNRSIQAPMKPDVENLEDACRPADEFEEYDAPPRPEWDPDFGERASK